MDIRQRIHEFGQKARAASHALAQLSSADKNAILSSMAQELRRQSAPILEANAEDIATAEKKGLSSAMIDRLRLNDARIEAMAQGIEQVISLPDPVGEILSEWERPNGLRLVKKRVPIGVIGIIYESRPNVTSDAAILCLKTGNATILRGGSEAIASNKAIAAVLMRGGEKEGLPAHSIQLIPFTDRESVRHMAEMEKYLDLIIPRGGQGLIEEVVSHARMPVIKHYHGVCHVYVHSGADLDMATELVVNSKCQKPSVCNALETLLVDQAIAAEFYPKVSEVLRAQNVELRGDERAREILGEGVIPVTDADWTEEYLDLILSMKTVDNLDEAVGHINFYGSHHSDVIVTGDVTARDRFFAEVDSAAVFHNASTRFHDGEEFGFGAEIGISTDKLHARGPMALPELTSYKYLIYGEGQVK